LLLSSIKVNAASSRVTTADRVTTTGVNRYRTMLFNNTMKWIEAFIPMDIELMKSSDKAVEGIEEAEEGSSK
nr:hypothetical protein [Tanacetum cinerariifolium]